MITALIDERPEFASPGAHGSCPACREEVRAKCGEIIRWHWAHRPDADCNAAHEPETPWHAAWKHATGDPARVEHADGNHRADAISPAGYIIEFQHSPIDPAALRARERHWRRGCWVYDADTDDGRRLSLRRPVDRDESDDYRVISWERPKLLVTHAHWPVWVDLPDRDDMLLLTETRPGQWVTGSGRLLPRGTFIAGVLNGYGLSPAAPPPGKPWHPEPVTTAPTCLYRGCEEPARYALKADYTRSLWHGCDTHWEPMYHALHCGLPSGGDVTTTQVRWP